MRYLVASHHYAITKEMRETLVLHFEDGFQSFEDVEECANRLRVVAAQTSATVEILFKVRQHSVDAGPDTTDRTDRMFDRV